MDTPLQRLEEFFGEDRALIDATLSGLARVVERDDLPTVDEIIRLHLDKKFHFIREAALVGMDLRYESDKEAAFTLPDSKLEKLCAFWLTNGRGEEPDWYEVLAQARPEVVAKVVIQYTERAIKAKLEYVTGIWQLGRSAELAAVANIAIPPLLASFPARASQATPWVAGSASQGRPVEHGEGGTHRPGGA